MDGKVNSLNRRTMLAQLAPGVGLGAALASLGAVSTPANAGTQGTSADDWYDARRDFNAIGDGSADDTVALQNAIDTGARMQRPIRLPPGSFKITKPLVIPSNTMLIGSSPGLGFGCRIEPFACAALAVGGKAASFQCSIENLTIWPKGQAPDFIIGVDNSYSVSFRNIRIHDAQDQIRRAAVVLLGESGTGGHGRCNNIIWDNLVVRNDSGQPGIAVLAAKGCGSHRFIAPDLENFRTLLEWQGGQIDFLAPYTERAGQYAVNCNLDANEESPYLNTFGGVIDSAKSGLGCAIRSTTRNFNSFGTMWGPTSDLSAYVYSLPRRPVHFHGIVPNLGRTGTGRFSGVEGWSEFVNFPTRVLRKSQPVEIDVPPHGQVLTEIKVPGAVVGGFWARVMINADARGAQLSAFVSAADVATVVAQNVTGTPLRLSGVFTVECGAA